MLRRSIRIAALAAVVVPVAAFTFGGWVVITVDSLPEYAVAGTPTTLTFAVRQHGMTMLSDLRPYVVARNSSTVVEAKSGTTPDGRYSTTMTLPREGAWTIDIRSGFMNGTRSTPLMPLRVVATGASSPPPMPDALRGKHLFVANADGTSPTQITDGPADDQSPSWSPDGKDIVFCSAHGEDELVQANLFVVHADGTGMVQLTEGDRISCHPTWSRDGYVYFHANEGGRFHIWRVRVKQTAPAAE